MVKHKHSLTTLTVFMLAAVLGCGGVGGGSSESGSGNGSAGDSGDGYVVQIAGSSTVAPVSSAVTEEAESAIGVIATVDTTGTGTGMERLSKGECDITGASRPMKDTEAEACAANDIEYIELKIGMDGISVVVHPENDWCDSLSVAQLKKLWEAGSTVKKWNELDPSWPDEEIKLFGPDDKSGTYDYFNESIIGEVAEGEKPCRSDYTPAVKDTVLVDGVKGDKYALGYFGFAYYVANKDSLKIVKVATEDDKSNAVEPTETTIEDGSYNPLSRPLFIYVNTASLKEKPEVEKFVKFYLGDGQEMVSRVGYVQVPANVVEQARAKVDAVLGGE